MGILVQKFGGTSLSTPAAREHVIRHVKREMASGFDLVIVVSAMGRKGEPYATDTLLDWAVQNGNSLPDREKDLLMCCGEIISATTLCGLLEQEGIRSTVLTGAQAGFLTDNNYGNARILDVQTERILRELREHKVVIVTGFQGQTEAGDFTTLGRGEAIPRQLRLVQRSVRIWSIFTPMWTGFLQPIRGLSKMRSN